MADLVYPELSYQLVGAAFKIYNSLGYGIQEKYYQRAYANELQMLKLPFKQEYCIDLLYNNNKIGKCFLDFLIDNKIIIELKTQPQAKNIPISQVYRYLRATKLELAIIIFFTRDGIHSQRVLNPDFKRLEHYSNDIRT